ncbi:MAG: peptidylprolyl isomerase [Cyanobacteriota bacterium]|nr:peptidylprolyl isomerase [Cyanobacteriota bacterium]
MEPEKFLSIGDRSISLRQAIGYLRASGDLPRFLQKILHQHVLAETLESEESVEIEPSTIEQAMLDFRLQNRLNDREQFDRWLASQGMSYDEFRERIITALKVEQLKIDRVASKAQAYFEQNKPLLDRVILSRVVVADLAVAQELREKILAGALSFEAAAKERSLTNDRTFNGLMGTIPMGQLPEPVRDRLLGNDPGNIVGPLETEGRYALLRIEQWLPATFEGDTKRQIQDRLFDAWVQEQLQNRKIQLHLN